MVFGENNEKGIRLNGLTPEVITIGEEYSLEDLMIHDETDLNKAWIIARLFDDPSKEKFFPRPFGIFYKNCRPCYEDVMKAQIEEVVAKKGKGDLNKLLAGNETWTVA